MLMFRNHIYISDKKYAFKDIFKEYYASQLFFAIKLISSKHDAEDIVQDVFMNIWKNKPIFKNEIAFKAYIYLSTRNKCLDYLKKKRPLFRSVEEAHDIPNELEILVKEEIFRILDIAIDKLPNQTKEVIRLSLKGYSIQQVADELKVSVNTVKTLKSRAYKVLKEVYGDAFIYILASYISF